jgi:hypothetical protein
VVGNRQRHCGSTILVNLKTLPENIHSIRDSILRRGAIIDRRASQSLFESAEPVQILDVIPGPRSGTRDSGPLTMQDEAESLPFFSSPSADTDPGLSSPTSPGMTWEDPDIRARLIDAIAQTGPQDEVADWKTASAGPAGSRIPRLTAAAIGRHLRHRRAWTARVLTQVTPGPAQQATTKTGGPAIRRHAP